MDASRNLTSPTLDFILGKGADLPAPTPEEFARILQVVAEEIRDSDSLEHIVGNRSVFSHNSSVWELAECIKAKGFPYTDSLRARQIYSHRPSSPERRAGEHEEILYLAYEGQQVMWLWLRRYSHLNSKIGILDCVEINTDNAAKVFGDSTENPKGKHFYLSILQSLVQIMDNEVEDQGH